MLRILATTKRGVNCCINWYAKYDAIMNQKTNGYIRVASLRVSQRDIAPEPGETVIRGDRVNPVLGNPHVLHNANDPAERDRVCDAFERDAQIDLQAGGPISRAIDDMARRVAAGERIVLMCWCKPRRCHLDWVAREVEQRANHRTRS